MIVPPEIKQRRRSGAYSILGSPRRPCNEEHRSCCDTRLAWMLLATAAAESAWHSPRSSPPSPSTSLIRGGKIVDGTGNPWFMGDVAIQGDRIAAVGPLGARRRPRERDHRRTGAGRRAGVYRHALAFRHDSLRGRQRPSKIRQGVTTEILGEDTSAGPSKGKRQPRIVRDSGRHADLDDAGRLLRCAREPGNRRQRRQLCRDWEHCWNACRGTRSTGPTVRGSRP